MGQGAGTGAGAGAAFGGAVGAAGEACVALGLLPCGERRPCCLQLSATVAAAAGLLKPVPGACMHMPGAQSLRGMQNAYAAGTASFREPTTGICIHTGIAVWPPQ
jgi:hypothetical protein